MNKKELENRLIDFSVKVIEITDNLAKNRKTSNLIDQVLRSASASALNYGEAQSAESKKDFIHKISIIMKELRETQVNLAMLSRLIPEGSSDEWKQIMRENDELLAIFHKTIQTARKNS